VADATLRKDPMPLVPSTPPLPTPRAIALGVKVMPDQKGPVPASAEKQRDLPPLPTNRSVIGGDLQCTMSLSGSLRDVSVSLTFLPQTLKFKIKAKCPAICCT